MKKIKTEFDSIINELMILVDKNSNEYEDLLELINLLQECDLNDHSGYNFIIYRALNDIKRDIYDK